MPAAPHVIWICQWYPHEGEPYAGDFIQRHAKAASQFLPITTFACFPHTSNKVETHTAGNLTEHIIYFKPVKTGFRIIDKALGLHKWYTLLKSHIEAHIHTKGQPDLLHCHIILQSGLLGLWAKKKYNIPYVVSEHWSGYMPNAVNGFTAYNPWSKRKCAAILKQSAAVTAVSEALIQILQSIHLQSNYSRIPNVVDEQIFTSTLNKKNEPVFRIIHISTFSAQKNTEDMFAAFDALAAENKQIEFHIVGPQEKLATKWRSKKFSPAYIFHKEMPQQELATLMGQCDVCILYSHYETFGCVIIEANAIGLPVVVSDIPVLQEIVEQGRNGVLVTPSSPTALQKVLQELIDKHYQFDGDDIAGQTLQNFAYGKVGRQFSDLYNKLISVEKP